MEENAVLACFKMSSIVRLEEPIIARNVRFEVITADSMKMTGFSDMAPRSRWAMMETVRTTETSV
jgi:hypothetical protein